MFVVWVEGSLTISVCSIQDDSHHIRRNFGGSGIRETLQCSGFSGVRAGDAINPAVSRWITRQTDHRRDRQDLRRGKTL